jgi:selenide,water dikinase
MVQLNRGAAEALRALPAGCVNACTDVTGFGLIGHASEVAAASHVTLQIDAGAVPLINGARALTQGNRPGGLASNLEHFEQGTEAAAGVAPDLLWLLYDPQTSGGLLVFAGADHAEDVARALARAGVAAVRIGDAAARHGRLNIRIR